MLRCRPRLPRAARRALLLLQYLDLCGMAVNHRIQFCDVRTQVIEAVQIFPVQHLIDARTLLVCSALELQRLLQQSLLDALIALRAKDALHDGAAILDLGEQESLKLPLREKDDLAELIGVKADELTDSFRYLGHVRIEQNFIAVLSLIRELVELTCRRTARHLPA